jgi:hypothetical protein
MQHVYPVQTTEQTKQLEKCRTLVPPATGDDNTFLVAPRMRQALCATFNGIGRGMSTNLERKLGARSHARLRLLVIGVDPSGGGASGDAIVAMVLGLEPNACQAVHTVLLLCGWHTRTNKPGVLAGVTDLRRFVWRVTELLLGRDILWATDPVYVVVEANYAGGATTYEQIWRLADAQVGIRNPVIFVPSATDTHNWWPDRAPPPPPDAHTTAADAGGAVCDGDDDYTAGGQLPDSVDVAMFEREEDKIAQRVKKLSIQKAKAQREVGGSEEDDDDRSGQGATDPMGVFVTARVKAHMWHVFRVLIARRPHVRDTRGARPHAHRWAEFAVMHQPAPIVPGGDVVGYTDLFLCQFFSLLIKYPVAKPTGSGVRDRLLSAAPYLVTYDAKTPFAGMGMDTKPAQDDLVMALFNALFWVYTIQNRPGGPQALWSRCVQRINVWHRAHIQTVDRLRSALLAPLSLSGPAPPPPPTAATDAGGEGGGEGGRVPHPVTVVVGAPGDDILYTLWFLRRIVRILDTALVGSRCVLLIGLLHGKWTMAGLNRTKWVHVSVSQQHHRRVAWKQVYKEAWTGAHPAEPWPPQERRLRAHHKPRFTRITLHSKQPPPPPPNSPTTGTDIDVETVGIRDRGPVVVGGDGDGEDKGEGEGEEDEDEEDKGEGEGEEDEDEDEDEEAGEGKEEAGRRVEEEAMAMDVDASSSSGDNDNDDDDIEVYFPCARQECVQRIERLFNEHVSLVKRLCLDIHTVTEGMRSHGRACADFQRLHGTAFPPVKGRLHEINAKLRESGILDHGGAVVTASAMDPSTLLYAHATLKRIHGSVSALCDLLTELTMNTLDPFHRSEVPNVIDTPKFTIKTVCMHMVDWHRELVTTKDIPDHMQCAEAALKRATATATPSSGSVSIGLWHG